MRVQRHEVGEVDEDERAEHEIGARPPNERDDEAGDRDQQRGPEAVPEARRERDRRGVVVLESEPPGPGVLLDAPRVAGGLSEVR